MLRLALVGFAVLGALVASPRAPAQGTPQVGTPWRFVVLNNADFLLPASALMDQELRETLTREAPRSVELFGESLDSFRHPGTIDDELYALLRKKYARVKVDLVMARSRASLDFVRRHGQEIWPDVPVVLYNQLPETIRALPPLPNATGIQIDLDPAYTLDVARKMQPGARRIVAIGGASPYDRTWKGRVQPILAAVGDQYSVEWLDDISLKDILEKVRTLPRDSIVLYTSMMIDAEGKTRTNPQVAGQVAAASSAPVYGFFDTYIGTGVVGGAVPDFRAQGRDAAHVALRVLGGEAASTIPIAPPSAAKCVVDQRVLTRFGIDEARVPRGCEVQFREPSLWRDYRWHMVGVSAAIGLQALLITALILQRRWRRRAELAAQRQSVELAHTLRLATIGEMTAAISHEINQPLGAILANAEAGEMLLEADGNSPEELRQILADIRREDLRASDVVRRMRSFLHKHAMQRQSVDPNELVVDTVRLVAPEAHRRDIALEVHEATGVGSMVGDRIQLQQLLINLVMNAMDAMDATPPARRKVALRVARLSGHRVEISVSDAGHGIEEGAAEKLFDSFFTTKPRGLGLGLSIARTIAEAHGGRIRAENNAAGGATFRLALPEARETAAEMQGEGRSAEAGRA